MDYVFIGMALALGFYLLPLAVGIAVMVVGGIFSFIGSIFK